MGEAKWPEAEFIIGNPPFLGGKLLRAGLDSVVVDRLFGVYDGAVAQESDLVVYWFHKALKQLKSKKARRCGLVATNSIRGGVNRQLLQAIAADSTIFEAWSDEPWVIDGAAVRVSMVCFGEKLGDEPLRVNGGEAVAINTDLTSTFADLTRARSQPENQGYGSNGITKKGSFELKGVLARSWLVEPVNPNGRPNSDVLLPWINGISLMRERGGNMWIADFSRFTLQESSLYELPFEHVSELVKPFRARSNSKSERENWWRIARPASKFRALIRNTRRYIATAEVAKHRVFAWLDSRFLPDKNLVAFARDDDTTFGILHSRFHETWSLRLGTSLEDRPRYTPTTTFETFPFPEGLTPNIPAKDYAGDPRAKRIAAAANALDEKRNAWLNPPDLVDIVAEITPTAAPGEEPRQYPDRILPRNAEAAKKLKERTLTNLYNERPAWLAALHEELDRAVAAAYRWPENIAIDDALAKLLELNLARAAAGRRVWIAGSSPATTRFDIRRSGWAVGRR